MTPAYEWLFAGRGRPGGPPPPPIGPAYEGRSPGLQRVLIVEDNWLVALEMEATLEEAGFTVLGVAVSAEEAIRACQSECPDLVLMDIRLLGARDGVDAAVEIRERFGVGSIFVSAHDDPGVRARAESARPLGWIVKPVNSGELLRLIAEMQKSGGA